MGSTLQGKTGQELFNERNQRFMDAIAMKVLIAAQEKILPWSIDLAIGAAKMSGNPRVFIPLHRGSDGFMSIKQFETFYWPFLKKQIHALVDTG